MGPPYGKLDPYYCKGVPFLGVPENPIDEESVRMYHPLKIYSSEVTSPKTDMDTQD